jgi:hypothetical protein
MTPEQVKLVQDSFRKVMPIAGTAADLFYDHLFEIAARADCEAELARRLHGQCNEIPGVGGLAQRLLQGEIGENARVELLEWAGRGSRCV